MGLLDSVLGGLMGGQQNSPIGSILGSMLGGGGNAGMGQQGMGQQGMAQQGMGAGMGGGIGGLLQQFEGAGLGHIAQSWVGNGPNQSVSPDQLQNVFGQQQVNQWAGQAGMQPNDFLSQMAQHLPNAVDQMTPNGQVPQGDGPVSV